MTEQRILSPCKGLSLLWRVGQKVSAAWQTRVETGIIQNDKYALPFKS